MKKVYFQKSFILWLAAFLVAAVIAFFYFSVPPIPILLAGVFTFLITYARHFSNRKRPF